MKKRIRSFFIPALIIILVCSLVACNSNKGDTNNANNQTSDNEPNTYLDKEMSDQIYDFTIKIEKNTYKLPANLSDFITSGWKYSDGNNPEENDVKGESYDTCVVEKNKIKLTLTVINQSGNTKKFKECKVGSVDFTYTSENNCSFELAKNLILNNTTTSDDIISKWGEPTTVLNGQYGTTLRYEKDTYIFYQFLCNEDNNLVEIDIRNWVSDSEQSDSNAGRPAYLDNYVAPTILGNDMMSYTFRLQGNYYTFPTPVSEFISNGWEIVTSVDHVAAGQEALSGLRLKKDGNELTFNVKNYSDNQVSVADSMVTSVYINNAFMSNLDFEVSGGILFGMTEDDFLSKKGDNEFKKEQGTTGGTEYSLMEYSNHYYLTFDKDHKLTEINFGKNTID